MSDQQIVRVSWYYDGGRGDEGAGEFLFTCPAPWSKEAFLAHIQHRTCLHVQEFGDPYGEMNWGDVFNEVDLGPEVTLFDRPLSNMHLLVNHDDNLIPSSCVYDHEGSNS